MNSSKLLLTFMLVMAITVSAAFGSDLSDRLVPKNSPSKEFVSSIEPVKDDQGNAVNLKDVETNQSIEIYRSQRWVETDWSPDSRWLVVVDHWDGHGANIHFFFIPPPPNGRDWKIAEIYATPWPTQEDCKWRFVKWNLGKGSALIECKYRSSARTGDGSWVLRNYEIPLDYP